MELDSLISAEASIKKIKKKPPNQYLVLQLLWTRSVSCSVMLMLCWTRHYFGDFTRALNVCFLLHRLLETPVLPCELCLHTDILSQRLNPRKLTIGWSQLLIVKYVANSSDRFSVLFCFFVFVCLFVLNSTESMVLFSKLLKHFLCF